MGANLTDALFPHVTHGFRGISLPVATYHVRKAPLAYLAHVITRVIDNSVLSESAVADHLDDRLRRKGVRRASFRRYKILGEKIELHLHRAQPADQSNRQIHS